jgi:hypothetical protein
MERSTTEPPAGRDGSEQILPFGAEWPETNGLLQLGASGSTSAANDASERADRVADERQLLLFAS